MRKLTSTLIALFLLFQVVIAQTKPDSLSGKYTRSTWTGIGFTNIEGVGEVAGYTISTTDEILELDKNHCAALTVNTEQGHYIVSYLLENPIVYYGTWKISGDTVLITYTKKFAKPTFEIGMSNHVEGIVKMEQPMQRKYLIEYDGSLTSLEAGDHQNYLFYKEEELIQ